MRITVVLPGALYQRGRFVRGLDLTTTAMCLAGWGVTIVAQVAGPANTVLGQLAQTHVITYHYVRLPDGRVTAELAERALELSAILASDLRAGRRVLVCCNAGRNRSSLLSALIYMRVTGARGVDAVAHLRAVRPRALANAHFASWLAALGTLPPLPYDPTTARALDTATALQGQHRLGLIA